MMFGRFAIRSHKSGQGRQNLTRMFLRRWPRFHQAPGRSSKGRSPGMSTPTGSVYGWLSEQTEDQMDIERRGFLTGGLASAGLAVLPGKYPVADFVSADDLAAIF